MGYNNQNENVSPWYATNTRQELDMTRTNTPVHYHVFAGTVGCLPDMAAAFLTKSDAESYAKEEARDYRDMGFTVTGNVKTGYSIDPINRLYVEKCTSPDCWDMLED